MRQIWISKVGPPEVLNVKEEADPQPKSGEVRVRVEASGVNFADIMGRLGLYPDLPKIPVVPGDHRRTGSRTHPRRCRRRFPQKGI
jgi:NADPH:quinone reductase-like Zn-dependent oxidoreductase